MLEIFSPKVVIGFMAFAPIRRASLQYIFELRTESKSAANFHRIHTLPELSAFTSSVEGAAAGGEIGGFERD